MNRYANVLPHFYRSHKDRVCILELKKSAPVGAFLWLLASYLGPGPLSNAENRELEGRHTGNRGEYAELVIERNAVNFVGTDSAGCES
jgi:hypothetical protein